MLTFTPRRHGRGERVFLVEFVYQPEGDGLGG
jgi:hypothetical protein